MGDYPTRYNLQFLKSRGIMADAVEHTAVIDGRTIRYAHSGSAGMVYTEIENGTDPCHIVESLSSNLMFDYAWVLGEQASIHRTFGDMRCVKLDEQDCCYSSERHAALRLRIEAGSIPKLFDSKKDYERLGSRIWTFALAYAQAMDDSHPMKDRLLEVMGVINELLIAALRKRTAESGSDAWQHSLQSGIRTSSANGLQEELQTLLTADSLLLESTEMIRPGFLNWIYENITCSLLNVRDDSNSAMLQPRGLKRNNRRTGSYYTPDHITRYIASNSLRHWLKKRTSIDLADPEQLLKITEEQRDKALNLLRNVRILDPAVGGGVFLIAAGEWLEAARLLLGDQSPRHILRANIINMNLNGVDIMTGAVDLCRARLRLWYLSSLSESSEPEELEIDQTIRCGNSLIGAAVTESLKKRGRQSCRKIENSKGAGETPRPLSEPQSFDWGLEFSEIMGDELHGFDLVIGNPPYGSILSTSERKALSNTYGRLASGGEDGTWNTAAFFIVRSKMLLKAGGEIGLIVPNSVLRVRQFFKTRLFLLEQTKMWEIVDEGSPFEGVTLEMVSLFCTAEDDGGDHDIRVVSRRPGMEGVNHVPWDVLKSARIFVLYYDDILAGILQRGVRNLVRASRGKDIPRAHVSERRKGRYTTPYATKGRSVKRYAIDTGHLIHADKWFKKDGILMDSYSNRFLLATKNYPYPRCVMKPKGMIHGGGAVRIQPTDQNVDPEALGAILNSRMVRFMCTRYWTNYSQLTTCMNTGIFEDLPVVYPKEDRPLALLFRSLSELYSKQAPSPDELKAITYLERVTDAITYSLYLGREPDLVKAVSDVLDGRKELNSAQEVYGELDRVDVERHVTKVMEDPIVKRIESSPFMQTRENSRRR